MGGEKKMSGRSIKDIPPAIRKTNESLERLNYSFRNLSKSFKEMKEKQPESDEV